MSCHAFAPFQEVYLRHELPTEPVDYIPRAPGSPLSPFLMATFEARSYREITRSPTSPHIWLFELARECQSKTARPESRQTVPFCLVWDNQRDQPEATLSVADLLQRQVGYCSCVIGCPVSIIPLFPQLFNLSGSNSQPLGEYIRLSLAMSFDTPPQAARRLHKVLNVVFDSAIICCKINDICRYSLSGRYLLLAT